MAKEEGPGHLELEEVLAEEFKQLHGPDAGDGSLGSLYAKIHALVDEGEGRSALCLSGGGIRSASFGLGVLQALAKRNLLFEFHYLSTVSGGGYIGGWLSAWRKRVDDDAKVKAGLTGNVADRYNEPPELAELRANSNYLTARLGVMSADTWTLVALYIRNLLLNWLIFLPAILGVLLVPMIFKRLLDSAKNLPIPGQLFLAVLAIAAIIVALTVSSRSWLNRSRGRVNQRQYLWSKLVPTCFAAILLCHLVVSGAREHIHPFSGAITGAALYAIAWLFAILLRKPDDAAFPGADHGPWIRLSFRTIAGAIAGALIGTGHALAFDHLTFDKHCEFDLRPIVVLGVGWVALSMFLAESVYLGFSSCTKKSDIEREWLARSSGWFVALTLLWAGFASLVLYANGILTILRGEIWWPVLIAGGSAGIAGSWIGASANTLTTSAGKRVESLSMTAILSLMTVIFLAALALVLSQNLENLLEKIDKTLLDYSRAAVVILLLCVALVVFFPMFFNVNSFSLHAIYRNRLARTFLGAARAETKQIKVRGFTRTKPKPSPTRDPFTGFDANDNQHMKDLQRPKAPAQSRLFHVINMALNIVGGQNLAWQERKAEPFAATPLATGNDNVGFFRTERYGGTSGGLTLGTAMAISGAAASPNQGYHSSPLVGLLMTLFNVRLGWWLGNPSMSKPAGSEGPRWGLREILCELFGLTTDKRKFIYLSDGGHFENLGIYEMVRRRCHLIVASDAGADPDCAFEDLGNVVRKVWIDLGVQIDFEKIDIKKRTAELPGHYCAIGKVRYPEPGAKDGYLLYLKPGFRIDGSQPADVTAYGLKHPDFPHESTIDQFFSESQMESYRSLGSHIIDVVFGVPVPNPGQGLVYPTSAIGPYWSQINKYVTPKDKPAPT